MEQKTILKSKKTMMLLLFATTFISVWSKDNSDGKTKVREMEARAAGCAPATALTKLEYNNVSALIETGGSLWQDRSTRTAAYEIPRGAGTKAIFSGGLWMGGVDYNNQIRLAANLFRTGTDFWPGPLTTTPGTGDPANRIKPYGAAEINAATCLEYDKFFPTSRQEIITFNAWYLAKQNGNDHILFPGYVIPESIKNWPAHGDVSKGEDYYLAPFYDRPDENGDVNGIYNPQDDGDYPWYDINGTLLCGNDRTVTLYGDQNFWWVFNDKGGPHTETGGEPIGMEIHAQAFAFATNDEINDMTFYNYEMINRSTYTLYDTYFGQFIDPDLGNAEDDYVGCDVQRGLGYAYNGDNLDENFSGSLGYGTNPPAIGVDFFEGPYQDNDGTDNPFTENVAQAINEKGIPYKGLGIGYGDGIIDNERFGMRKFVYFNKLGSQSVNDPESVTDFYNYLRGIWKDNSLMSYGNSGHISSGATVACDYMFPGESDPLDWGTYGNDMGDWTELTAGNLPGDRRFVQSAGPFTLAPGAVNNITVGVVYARASSGNSFASVEKLRRADDKAQALFDNCFQMIDGPLAPEVTVQELNNEIILYLSNVPGTSNENENYADNDPFIIAPDSLTPAEKDEFSKYRFQGYKIYQVLDPNTSTSDLYDPDKSRLIAQCDLKDDVTSLVNFYYDENIGYEVPQLMVEGENKGIRHSFKFTQDAFSQKSFINHKTYYFMAVAYAYNNFKTYIPSDPNGLDGQKKPYLESRMSASGKIKVYAAIPHNAAPENGGTVIHTAYGDGIPVRRIEGTGNGNLYLKLSQESEMEIVQNFRSEHPLYEAGFSPVAIRIVDPLNVQPGEFELRFIPDSANSLENAQWVITNRANGETFSSNKSISVLNEQIIPELGISVTIEQTQYKYAVPTLIPDVLGSQIIYEDSSKRWLSGVKDAEGFLPQNWIRSGTQTDENNSEYNDYLGIDEEEKYESFAEGTWSPFFLCADSVEAAPIAASLSGYRSQSRLHDIPGVDIVFTHDKTKWSRCPVLEMAEESVWANGVEKMKIKNFPSVDKNGNPDGSGTGMSWFPGYVIDVESGERLNLAFGEDSKLAVDNGRDMIFNPTSNLYDGMGAVLFGGKHYVYIFKDADKDYEGQGRMPKYDEGVYLQQKLMIDDGSARQRIWQSCAWVGMPMPESGHSFLETEVKIELRIAKKYDTYATVGYLSDTSPSQNNWFNLYDFDTRNLATEWNALLAADSTMELINVVPNPYYAYSGYESNKIDTRIKITNLPETVNVKIFSLDGTLVRTLAKDSPITSLDWDLKNHAGVPVVSGLYLIHVKTFDNREKILKAMVFMRPPDLENF
jgi:hypothetical protein